MKITIMRDQLIAALCTTAQADVRYYLSGVYVEATSMETRLTSTNGTIMSTQRADAKGDNDVDGVIRIVVPREAIEKIKKHPMLKTVEINDDGGNWSVVDGLTRIGFEPVHERFPDYRRIIPAKTSGVAAQFDPALIAVFAKAAKVLGATYKGLAQVVISHNGYDTPGDMGPHGAIVTLGHLTDYVGVISPLKSGAPVSAPFWAQEELV